MFRSAILVMAGVAVTAFISFFIVVSYPVFPRGERTVHGVAILWARIILWLSSVKTEMSWAGKTFSGADPRFSCPTTRAGSTS